jgi:hypothetical protein
MGTAEPRYYGDLRSYCKDILKKCLKAVKAVFEALASLERLEFQPEVRPMLRRTFLEVEGFRTKSWRALQTPTSEALERPCLLATGCTDLLVHA